MERAAREVWLKERKSGIGGSDAAAILGVSKWGTPLSVWLDKVGQAPQEEREDELLYWGRELEDVIARRYERDTGRKLRRVRAIVRHPDFNELIGTPDRLVIDEDRGVEIKTADGFTSGEWGEPHTDQAPPYYLIQCVHYMAITGRPVWDIAVLLGGNDFRVYTIRRDEELERAVIARLREFWRTHVVQGVRPEIDASEDAKRWIAATFPVHVREKLDPAPAEAEPWARRLASARGEIDRLTIEKEVAENNLKLLIGDGAGLIGEGWRATWKATKETEKVDWRATASGLAALLDSLGESRRVAEVIKKNTARADGVRRFRFTIPRSEKGETGDE